MEKLNIEIGTKPALAKFHIVIASNGPYLVYGSAPLAQQFIMPNDNGESWYFKAGMHYSMDKEPTALCRCGASKNKPYCDGSHIKWNWDSTLATPDNSILEDAEEFRGPLLTMTDNRKYCAFARFCDARGQIWNLVGDDSNKAAELTVREANHCPAGRLSAWRNNSNIPFEPHFDPSLGLIEDPKIGRSGPLWVRGGIRIATDTGYTYEVRNRVTLCRCGESSNKPFCDGTHVAARFNDGLPCEPLSDGEEF